MFNRRQFLKALGISSTALVLDPELLLWVPGQKKIFLPSELVKPIYFNESAIIALELERLTPYIRDIFASDNLFYTTMHRKQGVSKR